MPLEVRLKGSPEMVEGATTLLGRIFKVEGFSRLKPCGENGLVLRFVNVQKVCVETCSYLFVDQNSDLICLFSDGSLGECRCPKARLKEVQT